MSITNFAEFIIFTYEAKVGGVNLLLRNYLSPEILRDPEWSDIKSRDRNNSGSR